MFLNLKYQEKGTTSNVSQRFVEAPIAGPHFYLLPLLLKAALRGIYRAGIVPSFLNFPCLTPVSVPQRGFLTTRGVFRGLTALFLRTMCQYFNFSFTLLAILHSQAPLRAPLAATSTAGRDRKWLMHSLGKRN